MAVKHAPLVRLAGLGALGGRGVTHGEKSSSNIRSDRRRKRRRTEKRASATFQMFPEHYKPPKWSSSSQRRNKGYDLPLPGVGLAGLPV